MTSHPNEPYDADDLGDVHDDDSAGERGDAQYIGRQTSAGDFADWPELLDRFRRGWRTVAIAGFAAALTATALWWLDGAHYSAQATLALTRPDATLAFDERFRAAPVDPTFPYRIGSIRTYPELAVTDDIAGRVRAALGDRVPSAWTAAALRRRVRVLAAAEGTLLVIEARSDDPSLAADIANTWADVFSRRMEELVGATGGSTIDLTLDPGVDSDVDAAAVPGLPAAKATARAILEQSESALEAFHASAAIDARSAEVTALDARYRSLLGRRDRLDDVARDADRLAERLESGGVSGTDEALALMILRLKTLTSGVDGAADGTEGGGISLRFDTSFGDAPSAADLRALALEAADARDAASREAAGLPERLAEARSALAAVSHQQVDLERQRDLVGERLQTLGRREAEVEAAAATSRPELRLAAAAVPPAGIDVGPLIRRVLAALILGLLAGAALALRSPVSGARG